MSETARGRRVFARCDGIAWRDLDGEGVLFSSGSGVALFLNRTAFAAWNLCDGHRSTDAIAAEIAVRFRDAPVSAPERIEDLMERLKEAGIVREVLA